MRYAADTIAHEEVVFIGGPGEKQGERVRLLADESCDFAVVRALRRAGHDVTAIAETNPAIPDNEVLLFALSEQCILLTGDKDFGLLAYAGGQRSAGVILIRFRAEARKWLEQTVVAAVAELGERTNGAFVVLGPGRARLSKPPERGKRKQINYPRHPRAESSSASLFHYFRRARKSPCYDGVSLPASMHKHYLRPPLNS